MLTWLGVDLGGSSIRVGMVRGNTLQVVKQISVPQTKASRVVFDLLVKLIREVLTDEVVGIGVGVPGAVDHKRGVIYNLQNIPSWHEVPLKTLLESEFKIHVEVNNDANAFVVGEKYFGQAQDYENIVGLVLGTGMGSGIILNNHLFTGANGGAGEFGMLPYRKSILEDYCSGKFFLQKAGITGAEAAARATKGDMHAQALFTEFGEHLGNALKIILYSLDPEIIVLGGSVSKSFESFKFGMLEVLRSLVFPRTLARLQLTCSSVDHIAILGAAALCIDVQHN